MTPRLIATDLDGTLLRTDRTISDRTIRALRAAAARGVQVVLVTGRPIRWLPAVYEQLDAGTAGSHPAIPAVCANGAVIYDPAADETLWVNRLLPEVLGEMCRRLRAVAPETRFAVEIDDSRQMVCEAGYVLGSDWDRVEIRVADSLADLTAVAAVKLLARAKVQDPDEFTKLVASCLGGLAEATHSTSTGVVELSAPGITKAAGLAWLCQRLGVSAAEVVAFGDMPNDLPMLAWAGRAVAMGNAHPAVLAAADEVTSPNDDDGVAVYLEAALSNLPVMQAQGGQHNHKIM